MPLLNVFFFMVLALTGFLGYRLQKNFEKRREEYYLEWARLLEAYAEPETASLPSGRGRVIPVDFRAKSNRKAG